MVHMDHAVPIGGAIAHLCLDQWCTSGAQTWCSSGRFQLNSAIFSALSTMIAVQEQYASNEGLAMVHMDHAVPIGGAIVHLCLDQWCTAGAQTWCSSGRYQLSVEISYFCSHWHSFFRLWFRCNILVIFS